MLELNDLYDYASSRNVKVNGFKLSGCPSLSLCDKDGCYIAIDPFFRLSCAQERVYLAHEIGHCLTGSFYNEYSKVDDRKRCERRADIFAYRLLIDKSELKNLMKSGVTSMWELAEYFNVTVPFMSSAVEYYQSVK
ncbi:MAG: ImmA/IrrE family metallo-endopeptidase [Clostridia bacterium]|nr:ImmA/IrrE family metallo-endopeptidase [Clostridia bacterium]